MSAKKIIYIILFAILGLLFSILLHALIESIYLKVLDRSGVQAVWSTFAGAQCALPVWLIIALPIVGVLTGIRLGFIGWRIVYVEKRHWRLKKK